MQVVKYQKYILHKIQLLLSRNNFSKIQAYQIYWQWQYTPLDAPTTGMANLFKVRAKMLINHFLKYRHVPF